MEEKAGNNDITRSEPEPSSQTWLDETLSEEGLAAKEQMLDTLWREAQRKDLNMDQIAAQQAVYEYAATRIEIIIALKLIRSQGDDDGSRLLRIERCKRRVLALVSNEYFITFLKSFSVTENHPLSPANLFPREIQQAGNNSPQVSADVDLAKLLPHYTSPWKNAILLALLAKGLDADYRSTAAYISEQFRIVPLPDYCTGQGKVSLHSLVVSEPDIRAAFHKDRNKVKTDIELCLKKWRDSMASKVTN